jgi:trehalose/maltose hydrolase-like predicted phosphorylase
MGAECYGAITNPAGKVVSDPNKSCTQQLHLQSDIALAQWQYYEATGDIRWLTERGWPVLKAVAAFWSSKVAETSDNGYTITRVQTPDEYATDTDNDAYTNASASQALQAAIKAAGILGTPEPVSWSRIASGLSHAISIDPVLKIHLEHRGYAGEQIKQADVVMLTYPLNVSMPPEIGINDLNYYVPRTDINGPAMTDAIHSIAAASLNAPGCSAYTFMLRSYQPFLRKPFFQFSEFAPTQLSGTSYDFLTGIGGFMQEFLYGFTGLRYLDSAVFVDPNLPPQLAGLTLHDLVWRGRVFTIHVGPRETTITLNSGSPLPIISDSGSSTIAPGSPLVLRTRRSDRLPTDDLSRCAAVTASSSLPGFPPVAAVDGSPATSWIAASPHATFTLRFPNYVVVGGIQVIRGGSDTFSYSVQAADGTHWRTVATAPASSNGVDDFVGFPPISVNKLKLVFDGSGTAKPPNIAEVIVMSPKR